MEDHKEELAALEALDNGTSDPQSLWIGLLIISLIGKTFSWAMNADTPFAIATIRYYAGWADKITGQVVEVCIIIKFYHVFLNSFSDRREEAHIYPP